MGGGLNLAATIARMKEAGMTAEAIVTALECIVESAPLVAVDVQAERRRAADRARKAAKREEIPQTSAESAESDPQQEKVSHTLPKEKIYISTRAKPKTELPADWQPNAKTWALADSLGFQTFEAQDQLERMRDWAKNADGGKGRKSDWDAAFRNWLKRAADDRKNRPSANLKRHSIADSFAILDAVTDEAIRRADGFSQDGGEADFGEFPGLRQSAA